MGWAIARSPVHRPKIYWAYGVPLSPERRLLTDFLFSKMGKLSSIGFTEFGVEKKKAFFIEKGFL